MLALLLDHNADILVAILWSSISAEKSSNNFFEQIFVQIIFVHYIQH
jgi:hypothetical protein